MAEKRRIMSDSIPIQAPSSIPIPDYGKLLGIIGSYNKWLILNELMKEGQAASDIARLLNTGVSGASKQKATLVDAGLVVQGKGRVYHLAPAYRPPAGQRVLDFGHVVLRFGVKAAGE
ncbi:MAG: winged helix-turn-helix domain-containing protein [Syntrophales bacterium LBB04]|nr:winged helix-turn-helix domain-containing protein [Syntrophales bacterium LBB04]